MVKINNGGIMFRERGELQLLPAQFYEIKRLRNSNCVYDERMMINITFYSFNITVSYLFFFQVFKKFITKIYFPPQNSISLIIR